MIDEFNEFLFDYTSKISLDDIKKAQKKEDIKKDKKEHRIASPYTFERKKKLEIYPIVGYLAIIIIIIVLGYYVLSSFKNDETIEKETVQSNKIGD